MPTSFFLGKSLKTHITNEPDWERVCDVLHQLHLFLRLRSEATSCELPMVRPMIVWTTRSHKMDHHAGPSTPLYQR